MKIYLLIDEREINPIIKITKHEIDNFKIEKEIEKTGLFLEIESNKLKEKQYLIVLIIPDDLKTITVLKESKIDNISGYNSCKEYYYFTESIPKAHTLGRELYTNKVGNENNEFFYDFKKTAEVSTENKDYQLIIKEYPILYDGKSKFIYFSYDKNNPYLHKVSFTPFKNKNFELIEEDLFQINSYDRDNIKKYAKLLVDKDIQNLYILEIVEDNNTGNPNTTRTFHVTDDIESILDTASSYYSEEHWRSDDYKRLEIEEIPKNELIGENTMFDFCYNCVMTEDINICLEEMKNELRKEKTFEFRHCFYEGVFNITIIPILKE
jgi:hypothetical protein